MSRTIASSSTLGIVLNLATDNPVFVTGSGTIDTAGAYAIQGVGPTAWTIANHGHLSGAITGVTLAQGGTVTNARSGSIIGGTYGIDIAANTGTVTNSGSILATDTAAGSGIRLAGGGVLTNGGSLATAARIAGASNGVLVDGDGANVYNYATITGDGALGVGVSLLAGGRITNGNISVGATISNLPGVATIAGTRYGIAIAGGIVTNGATITGGLAGIRMDQGGSIFNGAHGTIAGGSHGVDLTGSGTIFFNNQGLVSGAIGIAMPSGGGQVSSNGTIIGTGGIAILGGAGDDAVVVSPGGAFQGQVIGGGGTNSLVLSGPYAPPATLTGIGTQFQDMARIEIAGNWTVAGTPAGLAGGQTITGFARADVIVLTGVVETGLSYADGVLSLTGQADLGIILPGTFTAADFVLSPDGTDTRISLVTADRIFGTHDPEYLAGGGGNDTIGGTMPLSLPTGADTMAGGTGDDQYIVDGKQELVVELPGEGIDTVFSAVNYQLPDNVENLTLTGGGLGYGNAGDNLISASFVEGHYSTDLTFRGGAGNDTLMGNTRNDSLTGGTGQDRLVGADGDDTLDGGPGADTMLGGLGDDVYYVDSTSDRVSDPGGNDTVHASAGFALPDGVETLVLDGAADLWGWGSAQDNTIWGNDGANALRGGQGNDTLLGQDGNDALTGGTGNDSLDGGHGDDTLDGGPGADVMRGGVGDDTYLADNPGDTIIELHGAGTDLVLTTLPFFILPQNVENLTLSGTASVGWGNAGDNVLIGNAAANQLRAGTGNDTVDGGAGADTLTGGLGADIFVFHAGEAAGDVVTDFTPSGHDLLRFAGYGSAADGATFTQLTPTDWRIAAAGGGPSDTIHFTNATAIAPSDYMFT